MPQPSQVAPTRPPEQAKSIWRSLLQIFLTILLLGCIGWILNSQRDELASIEKISFSILFLIYLNFLIDHGLVGLTMNTLTRALGTPLTPKEYLGLSYISALYNLVLPLKGGLVFRSYYLKAYKGFDIRKFAVVSFLQSTTYLFLVACLGILFVPLHSEPLNRESLVIWVCFISFAIAAFLMLKGHRLISPFSKKFRMLREMTDSWQIVSHGRPFKTLLFQSFIRCWLPPLRIYLTFLALGLPINMDDALLAGFTLMIMSNFSFTPGNIGLRELAMTFVMGLLGYVPAQALMVGMIERGVQLVVLIPAGLLSLAGIFGRRRKKTTETSIVEKSS